MESLLDEGKKHNIFKPDIDPLQVNINIAALGEYYLINQHTLGLVYPVRRKTPSFRAGIYGAVFHLTRCLLLFNVLTDGGYWRTSAAKRSCKYGTTCEITDKKRKGLPESGKGEALEIPHSPEKEPVSCLTDWHYPERGDLKTISGIHQSAERCDQTARSVLHPSPDRLRWHRRSAQSSRQSG